MVNYRSAAWMAHIRGMRKGRKRSRVAHAAHPKRSVHMARRYGRRAQGRRNGRAINWFKGGMITKTLIPSLIIGVAVGALAPKVTNNKMLQVGAAGLAGGVPAAVTSFLAPTILGVVGISPSSSSGGVSQFY